MTKLAIDIVLLPPEEIIDICIEINKKAKTNVPLGKNDFVPHNSLCIAVTEEENIRKVIWILKEISQEFSSIQTKIIEIVPAKGDRNSDWFKIKKNSDLQHLHKIIIDKLKHLLTFKSTSPEIFYKKERETIEKIPTTLKNGYLNYAYDKYNPHITLCCKEAKWDDFPLIYNAKKLALFHAGKNVTCRKILFETELRNF